MDYENDLLQRSRCRKEVDYRRLSQLVSILSSLGNLYLVDCPPQLTLILSVVHDKYKIINMKHTVGKSANLYPSFKDDPWTIRLWQHKLATTCASLGNDCTQQQKRHTHSVRAALAPVYMDCWQQSMCVSIKHNTASRQILCCKKIARIVKLSY